MSLLRGTPSGDFLRLLFVRHQQPYPEDEKAIELVNVASQSEDGKAPRTSDANNNIIIVDWHDGSDPANPRNWTRGKKLWVTGSICWCTFVVYCGSIIVLPANVIVQLRFGVSPELATLDMSMYVLGYGLGPMLFSPLSEIIQIGRNPPYIVSFALFSLFSILLSTLSDRSFAGLIVMRFFQGFFGSPILASGGASLEDIYSWFALPYAYIFYVGAMFCGPALGPLLGAYAVPENWKWPLWEIAIMCAPVMVVVLLLPETSGEKILYLRAKRLRKQTGNENYRSRRELAKLDVKTIFVDAIVKPIEIAIKDPAIGFACLYVALIYGTYYSFFEAFGVAFLGSYGFTIGEYGLVWLCVLVGVVLFATPYALYNYYVLAPQARRQQVAAEHRLKPALPAVFLLPASMLMFAWTARSDIHWIVPVIAGTIYAGTAFVIFQCVFCWVPLSYPRYVASLLAASDFIRAVFAVGFMHLSRPLYLNLGVGRGVSILGGIMGLGVIGMWVLYFYGHKMRAKSKFAAS